MNGTTRGACIASIAAALLLAGAAPAQTPNYNGIWQLSPSLGIFPLLPLYGVTHMRIVAQPPGLRCEFTVQPGNVAWSSPLPGTLASPTAATVSMQTQPSQCVWSFVVSLTFVGPDQITGTLQVTDLYNCFFFGSQTQQFTAVRTTQAIYESFADGCTSVPSPPVLSAVAPPSLSAPFAIAVGGVTSGVAFLATGFSNTSFGAVPLPLDLTPFGMAACNLQVGLDVVEMLSGGATPQASWTLPNNTALLGATFYQQALALAPGANVLGATMSNAAVGVIGP